jgi:cytochrome c2
MSGDRFIAPDYHLSRDMLGLMRSFLRHDVDSLWREPPAEGLARQMVNLRCTACHQRDHQRDLWFTLESQHPAQSAAPANPYDDEDAPLQTIHRMRPPLTFTGEKLRPEWTELLLGGKLPYKPRPKLEARMPFFPMLARHLAIGLAADHGLRPASSPSEPHDRELAKVGAALVPKGGFACVDCHAVGAQPALGGAELATINFALVPARLRKEYFDRYLRNPQRLLPGTMMPRFVNDEGQTGVTAYYGGDGVRQFEAIWHFMRSLEPLTK